MEVGKHLLWHLQQAGYDLANGPAPADVVVALRDRVQTLKDMAARAAVWYLPLTAYDEAAVAKHLVPAAGAPLSAIRERLAALARVERAGRARCAGGDRRSTGRRHWARSPSRCEWRSPAPRYRPSIEHTVFLAGRNQALERIDAALRMIAARAA